MAPGRIVPPPFGKRQPWTRSAPSRSGIEKLSNFAEVITVVCVTHDYEPTTRCFDTTHQRVAVASSRNIDDSSPQLASDVLRAVGTSVVCDDNFGIDVQAMDRRLCFQNTDSQGVCLVQARHDNGKFERITS